MANRRRRRLVSSRFSFSYASVMRLLALISPEQLYSIGHGLPPYRTVVYASRSAGPHHTPQTRTLRQRLRLSIYRFSNHIII
jgi:hypothetical protein